MPAPKSKRNVAIYLTPAEYKALTRLAKAEGRSRSGQALVAVREQIAALKAKGGAA